jgi:hypothetical protein
LDVDAFTRLLIEDNAKRIGLLPNETYTLRMSEIFSWHPVQAVGCSKRVSGLFCPPNKISADGMHWCFESNGPLFCAAVACMGGCKFGNSSTAPHKTTAADAAQQCMDNCEQQFMSLRVVELATEKNCTER